MKTDPGRSRQKSNKICLTTLRFTKFDLEKLDTVEIMAVTGNLQQLKKIHKIHSRLKTN